MATKKEEQDEQYKNMGFFLEGDFPANSKELTDRINFIAHDGGEARQDKSYKEDGETVDEIKVRFYWK
jgi:hypothetical protein